MSGDASPLGFNMLAPPTISDDHDGLVWPTVHNQVNAGFRRKSTL
nr:hypothetical protein JVH1_4416 [Rhodococcus sp. JVH1]